MSDKINSKEVRQAHNSMVEQVKNEFNLTEDEKAKLDMMAKIPEYPKRKQKSEKVA